jgi:hypothetical protein
VWGLWNATLTEWFNPGTSKPYFPTRAAAERMLPLVLRQYPIGKWEILEYPREAEEPDLAAAGARPGPPPRAAQSG